MFDRRICMFYLWLARERGSMMRENSKVDASDFNPRWRGWGLVLEEEKKIK